MKIKRTLSIAALLIVGLIFTNAKPVEETPGITFHQGSFEEAKVLAKKEKKLIFVDAYTTWCGPCKFMARNVFTDASVGEFYNANFINMKIDMESVPGREFGKQYRVTGYPTFLFIDASGKLVQVDMGMVDAMTFIGFGQKAKAVNKS